MTDFKGNLTIEDPEIKIEESHAPESAESD